jgi:hypothetical protein
MRFGAEAAESLLHRVQLADPELNETIVMRAVRRHLLIGSGQRDFDVRQPCERQPAQRGATLETHAVVEQAPASGQQVQRADGGLRSRIEPLDPRGEVGDCGVLPRSHTEADCRLSREIDERELQRLGL